MIRQILAQNPGVLTDPPAAIGISELGDSAIKLSIDPWVAVVNFVKVERELNQAIIERFRSAAWRFPSLSVRSACLRRPDPHWRVFFSEKGCSDFLPRS